VLKNATRRYILLNYISNENIKPSARRMELLQWTILLIHEVVIHKPIKLIW